MRLEPRFLRPSLLAAALILPSLGVAAPEPTPTWTDPQAAASEYPGFALLGEYVKGKRAIQVVPCQGRFYLSSYQGGLPGAGWDGGAIGHQWLDTEGVAKALKGFRKVDRSASLEFPKPPPGAVALFDGSGMGEWANGKIVSGLLHAGAKTKREFQDFSLHFEFIVPFKPELPLSHPDRGNSGVFALGAYEVQVSDNFGLDFDPSAWTDMPQLKVPDTWGGSIYGIRTADINMCLPPLSWQTCDVDFTAARFENGAKVKNARITVKQNGVLIHDDIELTGGTGGGPSGPRPEVPSGPIYIQNHHNPTMYRNVWVIER